MADSTPTRDVGIGRSAAAGYDEPRGRVLVTRVLDALAADPAFAGASLAMNVPMGLVDGGSRTVSIESYAPRADEDMMFLYNIVAPDYFRTLRIPLLAGREFARTDDAGALPAVIVNETLARRVWQTPENAVGKRMRSGHGQWRSVIGVARDITYSRLAEPPRPFVYYPLLQNYTPLRRSTRARRRMWPTRSGACASRCGRSIPPSRSCARRRCPSRRVSRCRSTSWPPAR